MRLIHCPDPDCGVPAEVVDAVTLGSSDGPVVHVKTVCLFRHWFFLPVNRTTPLALADTHPSIAGRAYPSGGFGSVL
ncbi:MAG TPA: hypothetical protein VI011_05905 [Asanoa sp.]